jgi:hypothetical protein
MLAMDRPTPQNYYLARRESSWFYRLERDHRLCQSSRRHCSARCHSNCSRRHCHPPVVILIVLVDSSGGCPRASVRRAECHNSLFLLLHNRRLLRFSSLWRFVFLLEI